MKAQMLFVCNNCNKPLPKWMGKCPGCGEWGTVAEKTVAPKGALFRIGEDAEGAAIRPITDIETDEKPRTKTGMQELDRVLGGGLVRRSLALVGGDPGIGKSTLLMQALARVAESGERALYISGEESAEQLKLRADRLGIRSPNFLALVENELETILNYIDQSDCSVIVLDSVQAVYSKHIESLAGGVQQIRHVAGKILEYIKRSQAACFLVGHVTKEGVLAGPQLLTHMVDTVLHFEGERNHPYRILRALKNRFGSVSEIGVFEMGEHGLNEVNNPSEFFLSERPSNVSGSVVTALVEGSRPILAEVQALVTGPTPGQGRRTCLGIDPQRVALALAVIEKKLGIALFDYDIFLNAVGGVKATAPAVDLAIVAAVLSSFRDVPFPAQSLIFGEIGLSGEVRSVSRASARINEAMRLGFSRIILPKANINVAVPQDVTLVSVSRLDELMEAAFDVGS